MFLEILGWTFFGNTFFETRAYCSAFTGDVYMQQCMKWQTGTRLSYSWRSQVKLDLFHNQFLHWLWLSFFISNNSLRTFQEIGCLSVVGKSSYHIFASTRSWKKRCYYPGQKNWDSHACQPTGACMLGRARTCAQYGGGSLDSFGQGGTTLAKKLRQAR